MWNLIWNYIILCFILIITIIIVIRLVNKKQKELDNKTIVFKQLFESIPVAIVLVNIENKSIEMLNEKARDFITFNCEDPIGHKCCEVLCPYKEDCCPIIDNYDLFERTEQIIQFKHRSDSIISIPILKTMIPLSLPTGKFIIETFTDISELKKSEIRFQRAIENSPLTMILVNQEGIIRYANRKWSEYIGIDPKDIISDNQTTLEYWIDKITIEATVDNIVQTLLDFSDNETSKSVEINIKDFADSKRNVLFQAVRLNGEILIVGHDITPVRRHQQMLEKKDKILSTVNHIAQTFLVSNFEDKHIHDMIETLGIITNVDRVYMYDNIFNNDNIPIGAKISFEYDSPNVESRTSNLETVTIKYSNKERWKGLLGDGKIIHCNLKSYNKDDLNLINNLGIKSLLLIPIFVSNKWAGFIGFELIEEERIWDALEIDALVTASEIFGAAINHRNVESEKINMQIQLMQSGKLASIGELASGVAHEINNPMTGIINYAEILRDMSEINMSNPDINIYINGIINEGARVSSIVKNLLSFAKQHNVNKSVCDIASILNKCQTLMNMKFKKDQIEVEINIDDNLPDIICHDQQIQQVIINIMQNASYALNKQFKYSPRIGGKILKISCTTVIQNDNEYILISFWDNGIGISNININKLFEPFFTTKRDDRGIGLGLSVTYGIINDHDGKIHVDSIDGEWTEFKIYLPTVQKEKLLTFNF